MFEESEKSPNHRYLVSICVPVLNEAKNILPLYAELERIFFTVARTFTYEIIFSDNNSEDDTWNQIELLSKINPRIRGFRFTKNMGFQQSILFNLKKARGDVAIQIDADLQDPVELIPEFLKYWQEGFKVVYGKRVEREETVLLQSFRKLGYNVINFLSEDNIPIGAGDFRLLDREILDILKALRHPEPYLRGFIASLGYEAKSIPYRRQSRKYGESKFNILKIMRLGLSGLLNHSKIVSKIAGSISAISLLGSLVVTIFLLINRFTSAVVLPGWTFLTILILLSIGINSLLLWTVNHYIHLIYRIIADEPKIVISREIGGN